MHLKTLTGLLLGLPAVLSNPTPRDMSICDKYTLALLTDNTPTNQYTLLTLIVNTVVIGNYTMPNVGIAVPGILAPGEYMGEKVNLLPYFNGCLYSSNRGQPAAVNFLDGGGAAPIMMNKPSNDDTSNQYKLLTHLYQFFGKLLGCSGYGQPGFPAYMGFPSMYQVHKFMDLDAAQVGYFIEQVGLAALSFGVTKEDATAVGMALNSLFGYKCSPPMAVTGAADYQSICSAPDCPLSPNPMCPKYPPGPPKPVPSCGGWSGWGSF